MIMPLIIQFNRVKILDIAVFMKIKGAISVLFASRLLKKV